MSKGTRTKSIRVSYNSIVKGFACFIFAYTTTLMPIYAQQIIPDGKTSTSLNVNTNITTITTSTIKGTNAFNSFSRFNVNSGNVANLVVPDGSSNLINLVNSEASKINGTLNSIKNNNIGGNVFFVNPYGLTIGKDGVVNVGSLTAVTPTVNYMNSFFAKNGTPSDSAVSILLNGTVPINSKATITNSGKINAIDGVKLDAGSIVNSGIINSGATFETLKANYQPESTIDIENVVNIDKLENASSLVLDNEKVTLTSLNDVISTGEINATGNVTLNGSSEASITGTVYSSGNVTVNSNLLSTITTTNKIKSTTVNALGNIILNAKNATGCSSIEPLNKGKSANISVHAGGDVILNSLESSYISGRNTSIKAENAVINTSGTDAGIYNNASVLAISSVTAYAPNAKVSIDGNVQAGLQRNRYLLINADSSIDPASTINATISNGNIYVDENNELGGSGGAINITGKKVQGSGTLTVYGGPGNIDIINNSPDLLNINNLSVSDGTAGLITINGQPVTSNYNKITVNTNNYSGVSSVNINNNTGADILLTGDISSNTGNVAISNLLGNILSTSESLIQSPNIILTANGGSIASKDVPLNIDLIEGNLLATANGDIGITETNGDLRFDLVKSANGNAYLTTVNGSIIDVNDGLVDLIANNAVINTNNIIGDLDLQVTGTTEINTTGDAFISGQTGDITANTGSMFSYKDIIANNVSVTSGNTVTLHNGNISGDVNIVNNASDIGNEAEIRMGFTDSEFTIAGDVNALANGLITLEGNVAGNITADGRDVYITELDDVNLNQVTADNIAVVKSINASIIDANPVDNPNITANEIILTADNGLIGSKDTPLYIDLLEGNLLATANGDISITETNGDLRFYLVKSANGNAYLTTVNGSIVDVNDGLVDLIANNAVINTNNIIGDLDLQVTGTTEINTTGDTFISGQTGDITANTGNMFSYKDIIANNVSVTSGNTVTLHNGNISGDVNIVNNASNIGNEAEIRMGFIDSEFTIAGNVNALANGLITLEGNVAGNITADGRDVYITELDDVNLNQVTADNIAFIKSINANIIDASITEDSNITAKDITLLAEGSSSSAIGTSGNGDIDINTTDIIGLKAYANSGDIFISELSGNLYINSVKSNGNNVYIASDGSILDGDETLNDAKISGNSITLNAGLNGNIGSDLAGGILEIETVGLGTLAAYASDGSIYIKEVGTEPALIVDTILAKDTIYLQANWKIQNFVGSSITTTSDNSHITLVTDDTKLFDDLSNTGGTITTGVNGIVTFGRETAGDIYASYSGPDNLIHPESGETTYVTKRELGTISTGYVELAPSNGQGIWGNKPSLNIIIDDNYDFINHPVDVGASSIYILRKTDGILTLGGATEGTGVITQTEIDNITADDIYLGNVLDPTMWIYGNTTEIRLISPNFSLTSSTNGPSNVTLKTSGDIIDYTPTVGAPIIAKNLTLIAGTDGSGGIGSSGNGDINIDLKLNGKLNALAQNNIYVTQVNGSMNLDKVESIAGGVQVYAVNNIVDVNGNDVNISAYDNVVIYAGIYNNIGSGTDFIEINSGVGTDGYLIAKSKNVYVDEIKGDLRINEINNYGASSSFVYLKATDTNGADVLDYDITNDTKYNIMASVISLEAKYGSIGTGTIGDLGDIDVKDGSTILNIAEAGTAYGYNNPETINIYHNGGIDQLAFRIGLVKANNRSAVGIYSTGEIVDSSVGDNQVVDIEANKINLKSDKDIGYGYIAEENGYRNRAIQVKLIGENSYLSATTYRVMRITSDDNMNLNKIIATTPSSNAAIYLIAYKGSILDGIKNGSPNIDVTSSTPEVVLEAHSDLNGYGGSIGEYAAPLQLNFVSGLNDYFKTVSDKSTYLNNQKMTGSLQVALSSAGGDYVLNAKNTVSLIRNVSSYASVTAAGDITVNSQGLISDFATASYSEDPLLVGNNVTITSGGSIGAPSVNDINIICNGNLVAKAAQSIYISSPLDINILDIGAGNVVSVISAGNIYLGEVTTGGSVILESLAGIYSNTTLPVINITGGDINLTSSVVIGSDLGPIEIMTTTGNVNVTSPVSYIHKN